MKEKEIEQWEYRSFFTITSALSEGLETLNRLGAEGWEAYSVIVNNDICEDVLTRYFLKRRIQKGGAE